MGKIKDSRFSYFEFNENQGFMKNFNQVLKLSKGDFSLIISDEDDLQKSNFEYYYTYLQQHSEISVMQAKTSYMYPNYSDDYAVAGKEAMNDFYMVGNYISGRIYNRKIICNTLIDEYEKKYSNNIAYQLYVHMFLDTYAVFHGNYCSCDKCLILEGKPEDDVKREKEGMLFYATYQSRIEQMFGFIEQIRDLDVDRDVKRDMLSKVIIKTCFLVDTVRKQYIEMHDREYYSEIMAYLSRNLKEAVVYSEIGLYIQEVEILYKMIEKRTIFQVY